MQWGLVLSLCIIPLLIVRPGTGTRRAHAEKSILDSTVTVPTQDSVGKTSSGETNKVPPPTPTAQSILYDSHYKIQSLLLHLFRRKAEMSLRLLNKVVPALESIQNNLADLVEKSADPSLSFQHSLLSFKEAEEALVTKLQEVEQKLVSNRHLLQKYTNAYKEAEQKLNMVQHAMASIILSTRTDSTETETETETELSSQGSQEPEIINNNVSTTEPYTSPTPVVIPVADYTFPRDCGGSYRQDSGLITYKAEESLLPYEGCVWLIQARNTSNSHLSFNLIDHGFSTTNTTFLSVGHFRDSQYGDPASFIWEKFESGPKPWDIEINAPVAFVHFVTSPQVGSRILVNRGFHLQFQALYHNNTLESNADTNGYTNIFFFGEKVSRKYPHSEVYRNNERVAIVVQPTLQRSVLTINWWDFEGNDNDSSDVLTIWSFAPDFEWTLRQRLFTSRADSSPQQLPFEGPRNDPMLLIFKSDSSGTHGGFGFEWSFK